MHYDISDPVRAAAILAHIELFQKLQKQDEGLISRIAGIAKFHFEPEGSLIFRQNDPPGCCYVVVEGAISIYMYKPNQKDPPTPRLLFDPQKFDSYDQVFEQHDKAQFNKPADLSPCAVPRCRTSEGFSTHDSHSSLGEAIGTVGPGNMLGELALLNNAPRATTLKCVKDCLLLSISKEDFQAVRQDFLQASETQVIDDFCQVLTEHCGSVVKAWRVFLDPRAMGELLFSEFVAALTSLQWQGNTSALWGALVRRAYSNNRDAVVGLREISPHNGNVLDSFKFWMEEKFGGALEMFAKLTGNRPNMSLTLSDFTNACRCHGCPQHIELVCEFLDPESDGIITLKDLAFLEINGLKRKSALEPSFVMALEAAKSSASSLRRRVQLQKRSQESAMTEFMRKIRAASGGSFIRGFRKILDRNGNLTISKVEMLKGCRQVAFEGDVTALWKAMDQDGDGSVQLPDLDVRMSLVLASFKKWCHERHGGCVKAMTHFATVNQKWTSRWSVPDFIAAVSSSGWPVRVGGISVKQAAAMVHEASDKIGTKYIIAQDVEFLDTWEPTPWIMAEPDYAGKEQLISLLRGRYANLIVAWRRLFDKNNKNHVNYKDFQHACMHMQLRNAPGVWRALDEDQYGFISLQNIDSESARVLMDFKEWAEATFGSINFAFRVIDQDRNNAVSLPVFKRNMQVFGFPGDVRLLFQSLKPDVSGRQNSRDARLRLDDMKHLVSWEHTSEALEDMESDDDVKEERSGEEAQQGEVVSSCFADAAAEGNRKLEEKSLMSGSSARSKDLMHFCRGGRDFEKFAEISARRKFARDNQLDNCFSVNEALRPDPSLRASRKSSTRFLSSPYNRPVLLSFVGSVESMSRTNSVARTPSATSKMSHSLSLPALQMNARPAPAGDGEANASRSGSEIVSRSSSGFGLPRINEMRDLSQSGKPGAREFDLGSPVVKVMDTSADIALFQNNEDAVGPERNYPELPILVHG
jgi:CRP-like cAMP-binding protein/Ca2+-binding EF-hand superfamily protein